MTGKEGQMKLFTTSSRNSAFAQLAPLLSLALSSAEKPSTYYQERADRPRLVQSGPTYESHGDELSPRIS
jgi:hypothetical protein